MTKCAGAHLKFFLESVTKVRRIVEAPIERDLGDALGLKSSIAQVLTTAPKSLRADPIAYRTSLFGKDAVYMAHRDVQGRGDFCGTKRGIVQMVLDVIENPCRQFQPPIARGNRQFVSSDAGGQDAQVALHGRPLFDSAHAF